MATLEIKPVPLDDEIGRIIRDQMTDKFQKAFVLVGKEETCMPVHYETLAESIEKFEVYNDDVWVCSFPKTGTTWTQEMVWMIANNVDFEGAKVDLDQRFPLLEVSIFGYDDRLGEIMGTPTPEWYSNSVEYAKKLKRPRLIKTHLPFSLLPQELRLGSKKPKMIYVMRNAKDACVSYYHHCRLFQGCSADLENFAKVFMADKVVYGSFWRNVLGYWNHRNRSNLLIIKYEDMKQDLPTVIRNVAKFLEKPLSDEQISQLTEHLSFESMKNNKALNWEDAIKLRVQKNLTFGDGSFIRSGTVGKYKEELSIATIKKFDAWIRYSIEGTSFGEQYNYQFTSDTLCGEWRDRTDKHKRVRQVPFKNCDYRELTPTSVPDNQEDQCLKANQVLKYFDSAGVEKVTHLLCQSNHISCLLMYLYCDDIVPDRR